MRNIFSWLLLAAAAIQFIGVGLPPGNADLISIQSLAVDLRYGDVSLLYPGRDFINNDAWVEHHSRNLQRLRTNAEPNWCFYPPLIPQLLVQFADASPETWRIIWGVIQLGLVAAFIVLIERLLRFENISVNRVLLTALVLGSYPVARSLELGQTSLLIAVLVWLSICRARSKRTLLPIGAFGFAVFVKPFVLLAAIPELIGKRTKFVIGLTAVAVGLLLISLVWIGGNAHAEYWNLLSTLASSQTAYYGNQSLMAGFMRTFSVMPVMDYGFQPDSILAMLSKLTAVIVFIGALLIQRRAVAANPVLQTGLWLSAALLALPVSWEHHLIFMLPPLACLWAVFQSRKIRILLTAATLFMEVRWLPFYNDQGFGRIAASFPLFGNLILFGLIAFVLLKRNHSQSALITTTA